MKKIIKIVQGVIGLYLLLGLILVHLAGINIFPVEARGNSLFTLFAVGLISIALTLNLAKLCCGGKCECDCCKK